MAAERKITTRIEMKGDKAYRNAMRGINGDMKSMNRALDVMKGILGAEIFKTGLKLIGEGIASSVNASIEFESALAGVAKTTEMSSVELAAMGEAIKALSEKIPLSTTELAHLVEVGGQLGVPKENLMEFAEVMANLGVTTNLSSEEAATALAKLANIMGTSQKDYEKMGSVIVELGNNMATTEADIVAMSTRLAAAGTVVGLTEAEVFALAATMSSLGIEAEAGGSAMSKLMKSIETMVATGSDDLEEFASVAGMSASEFAEKWKTDPIAALDAFITGLGEMDKSGGNLIVTLEKLGLTEVRMSSAILAMATSGGTLTEALGLANNAWDANVALANEAALRYGTTESKATLLKNSLNNLAIAVGDKMKPLLGSLMEGATSAVQWLTEVVQGQTTLEQMIASADAAYADTESKVEAAAIQAEALIDRLAELEGKGELTAAEQREWNATLERLQEIMPSTRALIDEQTGAIEGGTAALRLNTEEAKRNALETAKLAAMQKKYDAYYKIAQDVAEAQAERTVKTRQLADAEAEHTRIIERKTELMVAAEAEARDLNEQLGGMGFTPDALLQGNEEFLALEQSLISASDEAGALQNELNRLDRQIEQGNTSLEEAAGEVEAYGRALDEAGMLLGSTADEQVELSAETQRQIDAFGAMSAELNRLIEEQDAAYEKSLETVERVVKGFDKIDMPKAQKMRDTLKALDSQVAYMETYTTNLQKAAELGLSEGLVEALSDGSAESAAILAGIVADGGKNIDALNSKFAEVETGKQAMATAMTELRTSFDEDIDALTDRVATMVEDFNRNAQAYSAGADTVQGLIDGMNSKVDTLDKVRAKIQSLMRVSSSSPTVNTTPGHAAGLAYVPADGYIAQLHRGEMVLTALEARAYRAEQFANYGMMAALSGGGDTYNSTADNRRVTTRNGDTYNIAANVAAPENMDARALVKNISNLGKRRARGRGKILV